MEQTEQQKQETVALRNLSGGLELLVQLAEKGDIDPWDVDIIEVTDKYLAALNKSPRENLLNAGRAIFFASVLLRLKSDILLNISNETLLSSRQTENYFPEDDLLLNQDDVHLDLSKLETFLVRSSLSKQQRKRKISLGDLIFALQQAEEEEERRALRVKLKAERAFRIVPPETPEDLLEITQEEDLDEVVEKIEAIIEEHLTDEKPITLSFLSEILNNKTKPFIALLFLAHSQKVVLEQKDIYGEVFIYKGGTVIEEPIEVEKQKVKVRAGVKAGVKAGFKPASTKKKSIVDKIKEKITGRKKEAVQELTNTVTETIIESVSETKDESEVTSNGNNA